MTTTGMVTFVGTGPVWSVVFEKKLLPKGVLMSTSLHLYQ